MLNKGIVKAADNGMLTVTFDRPEACGDCHNCPRGSMNCKQHEIRIRGNAVPGDIIEVQLDDSHVVLGSMIAYLIPLAGFLLGLFAGYGVSSFFPGRNPELIMAVTGILGTALAYLLMRAVDPHFAKGRWEPQIVSIEHTERTE